MTPGPLDSLWVVQPKIGPGEIRRGAACVDKDKNIAGSEPPFADMRHHAGGGFPV
jgi:hypothetical protein